MHSNVFIKTDKNCSDNNYMTKLTSRARIAMYLCLLYDLPFMIISKLWMFLITCYNNSNNEFFRKLSACYWNFLFNGYIFSSCRNMTKDIFINCCFKWNHNNMTMMGDNFKKRKINVAQIIVFTQHNNYIEWSKN